MIGRYVQLAASSGFAALLLTVRPYFPDFACAIGGVCGGAIVQLITNDKLQPTKKVIGGEIGASAVMGFSSYVGFLLYMSYMVPKDGLEIDCDLGFRIAFLGSFALGATGSKGFRKLAKRFLPGSFKEEG